MDAKTLRSDLELTRKNRETLFRRPNLLFWYQKLYERILGADQAAIAEMRILEIGSGMSPLKCFYPSVISSDVMPLEYLDLVFDAHRIDQVDAVADGSLDMIMMTNVLHHLQCPLEFLSAAQKKLRTGGRLVLVEPFFSLLSRAIYALFHHETADFRISTPCLSDVKGPLSSANQALPYMIFYSRQEWRQQVTNIYRIDPVGSFHYTAISYMMTGGVSRDFRVPHCFYRYCWYLDSWLANHAPKLVAAFFVTTLVKASSQS